MSKRKQLSVADWLMVFAARCQTKQGRPISMEERSLVDAAFKNNPKRYAAMEKDVFNATVPFGSVARIK